MQQSLHALLTPTPNNVKIITVCELNYALTEFICTVCTLNSSVAETILQKVEYTLEHTQFAGIATIILNNVKDALWQLNNTAYDEVGANNQPATIK